MPFSQMWVCRRPFATQSIDRVRTGSEFRKEYQRVLRLLERASEKEAGRRKASASALALVAVNWCLRSV